MTKGNKMHTSVAGPLTAGTSLQGYVTSTLRDISEVFGEPTFYYPGEKVTVEWGIKFDDGTIATIYDWKRYEDAPEADEVLEYHIGGNSSAAVNAVSDALRIPARISSLGV
jgi:hypothetical protein